MNLGKRFKELRIQQTDSKGKPLPVIKLAKILEEESSGLYSKNVIRQEISKIENHGKDPQYWLLEAYCKHFNVTSDYLLGFRDSKPVDENLAMICKATGLSSDSIEYIQNVSEYEQKLLDALLRNGYFNEIAAAIHSYMETRFKNLELQDNFTGNKNLESEKMDIAEYRATKRFSKTLVEKIAKNTDIQNYSRWDHALEGIHNMPFRLSQERLREIVEEIHKSKSEDRYNELCEEEGSDS